MRWLSDLILFFMMAYLLYDVLMEDVFYSSATDPWDYLADVLLSFSFAVLAVIPLFQSVHRFLGRQTFYSEDHERYLKYFILFLRSFKDDEIWRKSEKKLMRALKKLYQTYAIGRPDELMPPRGAKRIYVGERWKGLVITLQRRAPIILQRINMTDNFLWEFDQCVQHSYLNKVIFWVTNFDDYDAFQAMVAEKYGMWFPRIFEERKTEILFWMRGKNNFRIYPLRDKEDYKLLPPKYEGDHPELLKMHDLYLYGRDMSFWKILTMRKPDPRFPEGLQHWDWVGCLFPHFYVICHSTKHKWWLYLVIVLMLLFLIDLSPLGLLYLLPMAVFGQNGRTLCWLSHRWESSDWFEENYRRDNKLAMVLGLLFWATQLITFLAWIGM